MPKAKPSFNPLRLVSPAMLMFCFVLFFLPWIELQCVVPQDKLKSMPKEVSEKYKKELGIDPTKPVSMATQSGLQIATGGSSPGSDMKRIEAKMKEAMKGADGDAAVEKTNDKDKDDTKGAPLLFLYPLLVLAGIAVAFLPIPGMIRSAAGAGCCGAALALILLQAAIGFPMENDIKKENDKMKGGMGFGMGMGAPPGDKAGAKDAKSTSKETEAVRVSWQFSLYLTLLLLLGAAGTAFLGGLGGRGGKGKYGRKKAREDYDDDDEDEEDDRPRKKRRDERDEDEDDRPKKRRRDEEDDEDDRPRKKARRDEDEYDDRPRKKKPLEPEFEMPSAEAPLPPPPPPAPAGPNPFAFDDDEPAPKKKPRRRDDDDDDYDDRPRKKRRRDDD